MKRVLILQPTSYDSDGTLYRTNKRRVAGITLPYLATLVEVKYIKSFDINRFQFVDDNFSINHQYMKELLEKLIALKVQWTCLWTVKDCKDRELLEIAKRSGVWYINLGMESINEDSLKSMHKYQNRVRDYEAVLSTLNKMGIFYSLNFIFG